MGDRRSPRPGDATGARLPRIPSDSGATNFTGPLNGIFPVSLTDEKMIARQRDNDSTCRTAPRRLGVRAPYRGEPIIRFTLYYCLLLTLGHRCPQELQALDRVKTLAGNVLS